jgi:hypothetical protein
VREEGGGREPQGERGREGGGDCEHLSFSVCFFFSVCSVSLSLSVSIFIYVSVLAPTLAPSTALNSSNIRVT